MDHPLTCALWYLRVSAHEKTSEPAYVELDFEDRQTRLHLVEVPRGMIDGLRYEPEE